MIDVTNSQLWYGVLLGWISAGILYIVARVARSVWRKRMEASQ